MSEVVLSVLKGGINRLRTKGGADPHSLYDLVNGYVDKEGNAVSRQGTVTDTTLPAGTLGLAVLDGKFVVFADHVVAMTDARYRCQVLIDPYDDTQALMAIHFAVPMMGALYVVAEFANGDIVHYWLRSGTAWSASTVYLEGDLVTPTVDNGLAYQASGSEHPAAWQPNTPYKVGDAVQPIEYNGYKYTVIEADGDSPASGDTEPTWIASEGAQIDEYVDQTPETVSAPDTTATPGGTRYDNLPGYKRQPGALE